MPQKPDPLDIPEFLRRKPGDSPAMWEGPRTATAAAPVKIENVSSEVAWRRERDALYAQQAEDAAHAREDHKS